MRVNSIHKGFNDTSVIAFFSSETEWVEKNEFN